MGEAKRRKAANGGARTWAIGKIRVEANDELCFEWIGTQQEAIDLQKQYLETVNRVDVIGAESYASRVAGYLIAFGMPQAGDPDYRPSFLGNTWQAIDVEFYRAAMLWSVMRQHLPDTGKKIEDVFVGKLVLVKLLGDRDQILTETARELKGQPFSGVQYSMIIAEPDDYGLNPDDAVTMMLLVIFEIAGRECPEELMANTVHVPRVPINATEADAMMETFTMLMVDPDDTKPRWYAGYTDRELLGDSPAGIRIGRDRAAESGGRK